jgi:hypothetical protein
MSTKQKYTRLLLSVLIAASAPALCQAAGGSQGSGGTIKCWKNDLGIRECGSIVPPEYSQRRIEVLNARGLVIEVIEPPKTREQLEKERIAEEKRKAQEAAKKEQAHQDAILLNSYATERDLIMARDTNVKAAKGQLDIAVNNLKLLQSSLDDLQTQAGNYERSGKKPPEKLIERINKTKQQIVKKQAVVEQRKQEKAAMEEHFENALTRFRKLKGIKPTVGTTPAAATAAPSAPKVTH